MPIAFTPAPLTLIVGWILAGTASLHAQTVLDVSDTTSLTNAINTINGNPGTSYEIDLTSPITLSAELPIITASSAFNGSTGNTISGDGVSPIFSIGSGTSSFSNLSLLGSLGDPGTAGGPGSGRTADSGGNGTAGGMGIIISGGLISLTNAGTISGGSGGPGGDGGSGEAISGGKGGDGMAGGTGITISGGLLSIANVETISGGDGGKGGSGGSGMDYYFGGSGGSGMAGGMGIAISSGSLSFTNAGIISGGNGGQGGDGGSGSGSGNIDTGGTGGNGMAGGIGIEISGGSLSLNNDATILGGNGGSAGNGGSLILLDGDGGLGGNGGFGLTISSASATLGNSLTISGGKGGAGGSGSSGLHRTDAGQGGNGGNGLTVVSGSVSLGNDLTISGGNGASGGNGGSAIAANGAGGIAGGGGSGGNGGYGLLVSTGTVSLGNDSTISGGTGGPGGDGGFITATSGGGGSLAGAGATGGNGGYGLLISTGTVSFGNDSTISGGTGGPGGDGGSIPTTSGGGGSLAGAGATGGNGGYGLTISSGSRSLVNSKTISGGNGGVGGNGGSIGPGGGEEGGKGGEGGAGEMGISFSGGSLSLTNAGTISGGNGGLGGNGGSVTGMGSGGVGGGNGGNGGAGATGISISGGSLSLTNVGTISGGDAGTAGTGGSATLDVHEAGDFGSGGNGGVSGTGISISGGALSLTNAGTISGGNGGQGGSPGTLNGFPGGSDGDGFGSAGSAAIRFAVGSGTVINSGTISGGQANGGTGAQADAIDFSGSNNLLELMAGSTIIGNVVVSGGSNNSLALGGTANSTFDASALGVQYQGFDTFVKMDSSTWTLTGANTFSGGTTINAGTLVAANANGLGTGTVIQNGGTLQTDNINHVIAIGNNFAQNGGTLLINLNGAPSTAGNDQVNVTGTAALNGNLTINYTAGKILPFQSETYAVVTTTGGITSAGPGYTISPTFQAGALLITIASAVDGDNFDVTLTGQQTAFTSLPGTNFTPNQLAVASYLDRFDTTITSGPVIPLLQALDAVSISPNQLGPGLDQLTPVRFESFASSTAFNNTSFLTQQFDTYLADHRGSDGSFISSTGGLDSSGLVVNDPEIDRGLQLVHSRLLAWSPAPRAGLLSDTTDSILDGVEMKDGNIVIHPEPANRWNVFISGNVVLAQDFSNATTGTAHTDSTTGGVQVGADYQINPHLLVGAMFAYGNTEANLDSLGSIASVDTYSPGVYASYSEKGWYANALGSYGFADYGQDRKVAIGGFGGTAHSSPSGDQIVGNLDGGYDFHLGPWTLGPTLGAQYVHLDVDGFNETGLPGADLTVNENQSDSLRSRLGGRISYAVQDGGMTFTPHLSASWQHEFLDQSRGITSQFDGIGAGSFVVRTANPSRDSALVDVGLDAQVNNALTLFVDYSVQAGQENYFGQSVQAGIKIGF